MADQVFDNEKLRQMTPQDLEERLAQAKQELFALRVKAVTKEVEDTTTIRSKRREIARILTIARENATAAG